jgi:hypothetical protein
MKQMSKMRYYVEKTLTYEDVITLATGIKPYVFRGQSCWQWGLKPTFERACNGVTKLGWKDLEDKIRLEFKRQAHHHISHLPQSEFELLGLMQHYGSPTRLLDFTNSIWVALFFAVNGANEDSALWAFDLTRFESNYDITQQRKTICSNYDEKLALKIEKILTQDNDPETDDEWAVFADKIKDGDTDGFDLGIIFSEPFFQNQRLSIQQGLFAFPKELHFSFETNTSKRFGGKNFAELAEKEGQTVIYKFKIPVRMHLSIIALLAKMNITAATLFPGLEGFARSQENHIRLAKHQSEKIIRLIKGLPLNEDIIKAVFEMEFSNEER